MEVDIDLQASEEAKKAACIEFRCKEFEATAAAMLGKPDNKAVSWDKDTGSPYSPNDTAFPFLQGTPHKVLAEQGHAANQLAAAERKVVEIAAKLQASRGVSKPAQFTSPHQESDKPSNGSSMPGNLASALGIILLAREVLTPVSVPDNITTSNVGQGESALVQRSSLQGFHNPSDGTMESANLSPVPASTLVVK
jgi:hypothetical protein